MLRWSYKQLLLPIIITPLTIIPIQSIIQLIIQPIIQPINQLLNPIMHYILID